jgi:hypothetical protein
MAKGVVRPGKASSSDGKGLAFFQNGIVTAPKKEEYSKFTLKNGKNKTKSQGPRFTD